MSTDRTKPNLIFVQLIHHALRVDGARLAATVADQEPDGAPDRVAGVRVFYDRYREQLVAHHTHEDQLFFPALAARVGDDRMHRDELVAQHGQLDEVLQAIEDGLAALAEPGGDFTPARAEVASALSTMLKLLTTHLDLEERTALPLFESNVPVAEYDELETKVRKATPRDQSAFMIPWIVSHASPDQRKALFRAAPPLRIVARLNRGRYRRLDEALLPAS